MSKSNDRDGAWKWLTERVLRGEGSVVFALTEDGHVGLWLHGDAYEFALGVGETCDEAVQRARELTAPKVKAARQTFRTRFARGPR